MATELNEIRKFVVKVKTFYDKGIYSYAQIQKMLDAGKITQEEFDYIVGES